MAFTAYPSGGQALPLLERIGFRKRRRRYGFDTQLLWDKLERDSFLCELSARRPDLTQQDKSILDLCRQRLEMAKHCLDQKQRRSFSFWELIHQVDGLLLLVLPLEALRPEAMQVLQLFETTVTDPVLRRLWLGRNETSGPLPEAVRKLNREGRTALGLIRHRRPRDNQLSQYRHVLQGALDIVNRQVDKAFWQMSTSLSIQALSTLLLLAIFAGLFLFPWIFPWWGFFEMEPLKFIPRDLLRMSLFGAGGATLSNMLSKEHFVVATGSTTRYFVYYLFVKPTIGAFAALFLFYLEQSGILLKVVILSEFSKTAAANFQIVVESKEAAFFARGTLAMVAGFSADRLLTTMMDKVFERLLKQSDKMLQPSAPASEWRGPVSPE